MAIVYDIDVKSLDDPYIHTAEKAGDVVSETTIAGAFLVDIIPICALNGRVFILSRVILTFLE